MIDAQPLISVTNLARRYERHLALRGVTLQVSTGERVALLGANGAGKTTLLRIIATLNQPTIGSYQAFGIDALKHRRQVRTRIGVTGHQPYVYPELTCAENLTFTATMYGLTDRQQVVEQALNRVGLVDRADRPANTLSRGLLQRLDLARATLHDPELLILDEPDTGLDSPGRRVLERIVTEHSSAGRAVIFTSHAIERALRLATRIIVLQRGELVLDKPSPQLSLATVESAIAPLESAVA